MHLRHHINTLKYKLKEEPMNYSPFNNIGSATHGRGSGGAMNNPMYRKVCVQGHYEPLGGRSKRRILAKSEGISLGKTKYFWEF